MPIAKGDLKDLGFKVSQRLMQSEDPLRELQHISQNLPTLSAELASIRLDNDTVRALRAHQGRRYAPGQTMVLLNGRYLAVDNVDVYSLVDVIAEEADKLADKGRTEHTGLGRHSLQARYDPYLFYLIKVRDRPPPPQTDGQASGSAWTP